LSRAKIFTKLDIRDTYYRLRIGGVVSRSLAKRLLLLKSIISLNDLGIYNTIRTRLSRDAPERTKTVLIYI